MGFLDKLKPQPRWKHADPTVRLEAVRELDEQAELGPIAEADPDLKVRRAAIARLTDASLLGTIAHGDGDSETRDRAADRLLALAVRADTPATGESAPVDAGRIALDAVSALKSDQRRLSTIAKSDAPEAVGLAALEGVTEPRVLGSISRHAAHAGIAAAALSRLADHAELLDVALRAEHRDVAVSAFERLAPSLDIAQLHNIDIRAEHKPVSRRARTMIQEIETAEAARHAAALERQRRESMLCDAANQLAEIADVDVAKAELTRLADAWQALDVTEPAARARFAQAVDAAEAAIVRRQRAVEEELDRQRVRAEAIATRVALCERVETVDGDDALAQLAPLEEEWRSLLPLVGNGPEADCLADRFAKAVAACRKRHALGAQLNEHRAHLEALATEAETLGALEDVDGAKTRWEAVSREAHTLSSLLAAASRPADEVHARFAAVQQTFDVRDAARAAAGERARLELVGLINRLIERARRVAEAETITLREGERLMRDIAAGLETASQVRSSEDLAPGVAELHALQEKVAPRVRELRELDDWRRFANAQRQEQLIVLAEAIVTSLKADEEAGNPSDLAATAKALRELHTQWQDVAEAPRQTAQRLWDRFRTSTDFIRSRCESYFAQLREERDSSLQKKQEIVTEAEALAISNDWVRAAARLQEMQTEWQALGKVGREVERELAQRFRAACNTFFARRREESSDRKKVWTDNLALKEGLCDRAEALVNSTEWDLAAAEMKKLQAEWKTVGPVRKNKSDVIWNRFRAAADRFFERYHSRHEIALAAKLSEREAVVSGLEHLSTLLSGEVPADFGEQVQKLRADWHRTVPMQVPGMKELADRWQAALTRAIAVKPEAFAGTDLDPAAVVQRMQKLVARVESMVSELCHAKETRLSPTEQLAAKLREALASNSMGGRAADDTKWRAALDAIKDAQGAWHRLPPIESAEGPALLNRFRDACRRLTDQGRRHVQTGAASASPSRPRTPRREAQAV